jgi:mannose-6-phosphate isomerase-like protein (cupin superfamily)
MITLTNVKAELEKLSMLRDRTPSSSSAQKKKAIVRLASCRDGSISASKFADDRGWERHRNGEEIVEIIDGATMLNLVMDDGVQSLSLSTGMMVIVPQGMWHRFNSPDGVTLITVTPQPTDDSTIDVEGSSNARGCGVRSNDHYHRLFRAAAPGGRARQPVRGRAACESKHRDHGVFAP